MNTIANCTVTSKFRLIIWWLTAPAQPSRVRRNAFECNNNGGGREEEEQIISPRSLPSSPKLAWLLRRLAQTAEDFANFDNLVETKHFAENGFDDLYEETLLSMRQEEKGRILYDFHRKQNSMNRWTDDIDFDLLQKR